MHINLHAIKKIQEAVFNSSIHALRTKNQLVLLCAHQSPSPALHLHGQFQHVF